MRRQVVITGLGTVTALGAGIDPLWEGLVGGRSGIRPAKSYDAGGFANQLAAEVLGPDGTPGGFSAKEYVPKSYRKAVKVMARDIELAVAAAKHAVEDAGLVTRGTLGDAGGSTSYPGERVGCHIGAGLIAPDMVETVSAMGSSKSAGGELDLRLWGAGDGGGGGMNNLPPLWMLKYLPNMLACHVTIIHGAEGPSNTLTCAEASGLLSVGESARVIERGSADACFAGSAESKVSLVARLRLELAGRLSPGAWKAGVEWAVVRPFDPEGQGGVPGEAGGILLLEEAGAARARGARAYARVAGFGAGQSLDTHVPALEGEIDPGGLERAVGAALADAGVGSADIDAIVPQGLGVPKLDDAERTALARVLGARLEDIPMVTLAPVVGDCAAGQGGVALAVGARCLREQRLPARLHAGEARGAQAGPVESRSASLRRVLVCAQGMGGQNAAIVLEAVDP